MFGCLLFLSSVHGDCYPLDRGYTGAQPEHASKKVGAIGGLLLGVSGHQALVGGSGGRGGGCGGQQAAPGCRALGSGSDPHGGGGSFQGLWQQQSVYVSRKVGATAGTWLQGVL